jgi:hypothetical protein
MAFDVATLTPGAYGRLAIALDMSATTLQTGDRRRRSCVHVHLEFAGGPFPGINSDCRTDRRLICHTREDNNYLVLPSEMRSDFNTSER